MEHANAADGRRQLRLRAYSANLCLLALLAGCSSNVSEPAIADRHVEALSAPNEVTWPNSGGTIRMSRIPPQSYTNTAVKIVPLLRLPSVSLTGDKSAMLGSANVRFGPYTVTLSNTAANTFTQGYTVTVWAASPGLAPSSNPLEFVKVGETSGSVTANTGQTVSTSISVLARLDSVFSDIKITVSFTPSPTSAVGPPFYDLPPGTIVGTFPSAACGATTPGVSSTTDACFQAAVNPVGVLVPDVMPLSLVYEPPGNCSWSNLTFTSSLGTAMNLSQSDGSTNSVLRVFKEGPLAPTTTTTTETSVNSTNGAFSSFSSTATQTFGSALAFPVQAPGSGCRSAQLPSGAPTRGPGVGDQFALAIQPTFLYWNTGGREGFRLSTKPLEGTQPTIATAYVFQIDPDHPELAPSFLARLSGDQLRSLRALDPMAPVHGAADTTNGAAPVAATSGRQLPPTRYIFLGRRCNSAGSATQTTQGNTYSDETLSQLTSGFKLVANPSTVDTESVNKVLMSGTAAAVGAFFGGFSGGSDAYSTVNSNYDKYLVSNVTTTTVTETMAANTALLSNSNNQYAESFFLQDLNHELDVDLYYDTFFGTILFNPISSCSAPANVWNVQALPFDTDSSPSPWPYADWVWGQFKSQCPPGSPVVGLSASVWGMPHSVLCRSPGAVPPLPFEPPGGATTSVQVFNASNSDGYGARGDWSEMSFKGECPGGGFVTGVARDTGTGTIDHVECASALGSTATTNNDCEFLSFPPVGAFGDNPATLVDGDWAPGFTKLECTGGKVMAGLSSYSPWADGPAGTAHGILCCGVSL